MKLAFSPCPNDTFIFYGWVHGKVEGPACTPHLYDIETLNQSFFPLMKVSVAEAFNRGDDYSILPVGAALGFGCGPLVIGRYPLKKVAIPGKKTVAHLLFDLLIEGEYEKIFTTYDKIIPLIESGEVDGGVIIHESRFIYKQPLLYDLGTLWEQKYQMPLPLGCLILHKNEDPKIIKTLQDSIAYTRSHRDEAFPFIQLWSQEKNREVIEQHIALYVNEETYELSPLGRRAIVTLFELAKAKGLLNEQAALRFCH